LDNFFTSVKSGILLALKYSENNEIEKIKTIEAPLWNMVLQNILCIYFPDKFITIGAPDVLIECARDITHWHHTNNKNHTRQNYLLCGSSKYSKRLCLQ
jgi:5-methylcytosine-specific restriction protein B